jgi:hypothetical protein
MELDQLEVDYMMDQVKKQVEKGRMARKKAKESRVAAKKADASRPRNAMYRHIGLLMHQ